MNQESNRPETKAGRMAYEFAMIQKASGNQPDFILHDGVIYNTHTGTPVAPSVLTYAEGYVAGWDSLICE